MPRLALLVASFSLTRISGGEIVLLVAGAALTLIALGAFVWVLWRKRADR